MSIDEGADAHRKKRRSRAEECGGFLKYLPVQLNLRWPSLPRRLPQYGDVLLGRRLSRVLRWPVVWWWSWSSCTGWRWLRKPRLCGSWHRRPMAGGKQKRLVVNIYSLRSSGSITFAVLYRQVCYQTSHLIPGKHATLFPWRLALSIMEVNHGGICNCEN